MTSVKVEKLSHNRAEIRQHIFSVCSQTRNTAYNKFQLGYTNSCRRYYVFESHRNPQTFTLMPMRRLNGIFRNCSIKLVSLNEEINSVFCLPMPFGWEYSLISIRRESATTWYMSCPRPTSKKVILQSWKKGCGIFSFIFLTPA